MLTAPRYKWSTLIFSDSFGEKGVDHFFVLGHFAVSVLQHVVGVGIHRDSYGAIVMGSTA